MIRKKHIKIAVLMSMILLTVLCIFRYRNLITDFTIEDLQLTILSYGKLSLLIFLLLFSLKPVILIVPTAVIAIAAGGIYGPIIGSLLNIAGCLFSSSLGFGLSRFLGKGFSDKLLKGKAMKLDNSMEKHGFKIMLIMRLSVVFPFDALSYAAGLTKMKYKDFVLGTVLGTIPEMVSYAYAGQSLENPLSVKFIAPLVALLCIGLMFSSILKKIKRDT